MLLLPAAGIIRPPYTRLKVANIGDGTVIHCYHAIVAVATGVITSVNRWTLSMNTTRTIVEDKHNISGEELLSTHVNYDTSRAIGVSAHGYNRRRQRHNEIGASETEERVNGRR